MAFNTADKRASAVNLCLPWGRVWQEPDGNFGQGDRQQMTYLYRGFNVPSSGIIKRLFLLLGIGN